MQHQELSGHTVSYKTNILIWLALLFLTGLTVWIADIDLGRYGILLNILIASVKAGFIVYIFMHLKYETVLFKLMLFFVLFTLTTIIVLTFLDVLYR